ncbi:hypothetical protein OsI_06109 [Oryza sativa Indica Group]|uniref:Uncharacterized protein n=1 Tax=Oryza sativa subsp. indica TaxID=39946 RepID=A2X1M9_ORYSI|nr:hypothetical protein OsI_06109 [Oryza sativa Indica Group]
MASSPAIGARKKKLVRISDFLLLHDDSDGAGGADHELLRRRRRRRRRQEDEEEEVVAAAAAQVASPPSPGTPRLRIPGFTCARLRFVSFRGGRGGRRDGGRKEELAAEKSEAASSSADEASGREVAAGSGSGSGASSSAATATTTEAAAGLGLSLLFLLARTSAELNKMAEVRAQMEALLSEMRDEAAICKRNIAAAARRELRTTSSSSSSISTRLASGYSSNTSSAGRAASSPAANGEVEIKKPLQEEEWSDDGEFIELEGGFGFVAGGDEEDGGSGGGGVSGVELERRLREVQHERDRERVAELESALRRAERRLIEKEMEARLWKDTAELALQRPPPPPPLAGGRQ